MTLSTRLYRSFLALVFALLSGLNFVSPGLAQENEPPQDSGNLTIEFPEILRGENPPPSSPAFPMRIASDVTILECGFGLLKPRDSKGVAFTPATAIPLDGDVNYGWVVKMKTTRSKIAWKEVFELPRMPLSWDSPDASISDDQRTATFQRESIPDNGYIWNFWGVAFGDPEGVCKIRLYVEGQFVQEFVFTCLYPENDKPVKN